MLISIAIIITSILGGAFTVYYLLFNARSITVRLFEDHGAGVQIRKIIKVVEKTDSQDKSLWLVTPFWFGKWKMPKPPGIAFILDTKGKKYLDIQVEDGTAKFPIRRLSTETWRQYEKILVETGTLPLEESKKFILRDKPFTIQLKQIELAQLKRSEEWKKKNFLSPEFILPMTALTIMGFLGIMLMVFWSDISQPALQSHQMALETQKMNVRIMTSLGIKVDTPQIIEGQAGDAGITGGDSEKPPISDRIVKGIIG